MKTGMIVGAGVAAMMVAGVAMAQTPAPPPPAAPPPAAEGMPHGGPMGDRMGGPGGEGMRHGHWGQMMRAHMGMRLPPPSKAAHFRFRKGDAVVDIKCADDEATQACVNAASALMDKLPK